jgi:hypothetical protein
VVDDRLHNTLFVFTVLHQMDFSHMPHNVEAPTIFLSQLKSSNCLGLGDRCRYFGKGLSVVSLLASSSTFSLPLIPT